jgi:adenine phosphoribosyltransferase
MDLKSQIRDVPDFPKAGILFKDITTLLKNSSAFKFSIDNLAEHYKTQKVDAVIGIESRGFIFASPIALQLGAGFIPVRKFGKLPAETVDVEYALEYGTDKLSIHKDAVLPGQKILLIDDLLATGGTAAGVVNLIEGLGAEIVGIGFLIELTFLKGREKLKGHKVFSLIKY